MTVPEALEMVRRAGSIRVENGKLLARLSEAERARLQPALAFLRNHREETAQLLAESAAEPATPARAESVAPLAPTGPIAEPTLTNGDSDERGADRPSPLTAAAIGDEQKKVEANRESAEPPPESLMPLRQSEQERLKAAGWRTAHNEALPIEERREGLLRVIDAHYWRSLESWERVRRVRWGMPEHGDFHAFACSWIWAHGFRTDEPFHGLEPVFEALRQKYPTPAKPEIGEGSTYWGSGADHRHRNKLNSPPMPGKEGAADE